MSYRYALPPPVRSLHRTELQPLGRLGLVLAVLCTTVSTRPTQAADADTDQPSRELQRYQVTARQMGTEFVLTFYAPTSATANQASTAAEGRIEELNAIFSDYEASSESRRLTAHFTKAWQTAEPTPANLASQRVSKELWEVLSAAQALSVRSAGAFDITVGPLSRLWRRARRRRELPDQEAVARAREAVGYRWVELGPTRQLVRLGRPDMQLDFGGIAKGYAADEALRVLRQAGCGRALIDAGGDLVLGDPPPDAAGWRVGVAPLGPDGVPSETLLLSNCGVATSGDAWQFVELAGQRYSHILDPRSGWPLTTRMGVTVVAPTGMAADGLASAVSVLGMEDGLELLQSTPATAGTVVIVRDNRATATASPRFAELPRATLSAP